jgi:hypothetical protein
VRAYWDSALPLRFLGPTYIGIIADKLARWFVEEHYSNPDVEVLGAARRCFTVMSRILLLVRTFGAQLIL